MTSPSRTPAWISGADRDHLVGIDSLVRLLAGQLLHPLAHRGHAGHPADQYDCRSIRGSPSVIERAFFTGPTIRAQQIGGQLVQFRAA